MEQNKLTILIVDDEEKTRKVLKINLADTYRILLASNGGEAVKILNQETVHLVLTDLKMPEMNGLELLHHIRDNYKNIPVILMTAYGTVENAVEAMKMGAYDYILKPVKISELELLLEKALRFVRLLEENIALKERLRKYEGFPEIISANPKIKSLLELIKQVASTDATILIEGESGTGKGLFARAVHYLSPRAEGAFIEINCAAIPHDLLESELFGHERGAFTGAVATKKGKFELAHHGSLFLDEIGEMPLDLQVKLLHVLENQKFTRLGGTQFLQTNTRIIAATNRNLREEVTQKRFRQDLFYRLKVVYLHIPPLRERPEDIPALAQYFLNKHQNSAPQKITRFSEEALQLLLQYPWPGNVREMENVILQAMIFAQNGIITPAVLPEEILTYQGSASTPLTKTDLQIEKNRRTEKIITDLERQFLTRVLQKTHGNISEAARLSGYDRRQIQNLIKKHRINSEDFK